MLLVFDAGSIVLLCLIGTFHGPKSPTHAGEEELTGKDRDTLRYGEDRPEARQNVAPAMEPADHFLVFVRRYRKFMLFLIGVALIKANHTILNTYLNIIVDRVGGNSTDQGIAAGFAAALELPTMALFAVLMKKFSCSRLLKICSFFFIVKTVLTYLATSMTMIYVAQSFQMVAFAMLLPAATYYSNACMEDCDKVKGQAVFNIFLVSVANIVGSFGGGFIIDHFGVNAVFYFAIALSVAGFVIILATASEKNMKKRYA